MKYPLYLLMLLLALCLQPVGAQDGDDEDDGAPRVAANDTILEENGFIAIPSATGWYGCIRCRMVPINLRAEGSMSSERPDHSFVQQHHKICKADSFDLSTLLTITKKMVASVPGVSMDLFKSSAFKEFVGSLVGGNEALVQVFTDDILELETIRTGPESSTIKGDENRKHCIEERMSIESKGLWSSFPANIDTGAATSLLLDDLLREVDEESGRLLLISDHFKDYIRTIAPSCIDLSWMRKSEGIEK